MVGYLLPGLLRREPEQLQYEAMLPVFPRADSARPRLHPPVADGRVSGRLPDTVPALEDFRERAVHQGLQTLAVWKSTSYEQKHRVDDVRASEVDFHTGCTCPNCYRKSPIGSGGMETCPQLCAGNLITSRYAKECDDLCGNQPVALMA